MYDYKMFYVWAEILVYLLENFGKLHSKISRFLFLSHIPVKNTKIIVYKTVNLYFPFYKLYNIYGMSFSNAKIIYTLITSFNVNKMSLDRALCS